ncbi:unnamed protein product [Ilex paraguariensis]|uniref:Uncharacterized protein n=1 Tax=Ilex paraguariensis TaxID=185542 RepID=A0ABC8RRB6_9AQUA
MGGGGGGGIKAVKLQPPFTVQQGVEPAPPKRPAEVGETMAEIVQITVSDQSEGMSPLRLPSPTLLMHVDDPSIPGTLLIYPGGTESGELDEILGVGEGSLRRHQS